jgi:pyruvate formate lyase activating enzyme
VTCGVCPRGCKLSEGAWGFCEVRAAHHGVVQDMYRSAIGAPGIKFRWGDDISWGFSGLRKGMIAEVYLPGCNLKCEFCVAPYLAEMGQIKGIRWVEADELVRSTAGSVDLLGFSGGEASVHVEYVTEVFSQCQSRGIRTVLETNGYMTANTARSISKCTDYVGFGLKASLDPTFYREKMGVISVHPIHEAAKIFAENGCEVMLTNLTDPNLWNDREAFENLVSWIAQDLGSEIRLVLVSLERPEVPPPWTDERIFVTPLEQREAYVQQYKKIAADAGLHQVFVQTNIRKKYEERQKYLEKIGLFRAMERLATRPPRQRW